MNISVIGAGASGIMAALNASWQGASVTLFERNTSIGRKLLVTGSGRCNLTNDRVVENPYSCDDPAWTKSIVDRFGVSDLLDVLEKIGIPAYKTWDGWYYPMSNSAHSVVNAMTHAIQTANIKTLTSSHVVNISKGKNDIRVHFIHDNQQHSMSFDRVIIAAGGKAYPTLGSKGDMFPILEDLGHTINQIKPALAPVLADLGKLKLLKGTRLDLETKLFQGSERLACASGNVIFTEWGLNGPAVMDLSHHIPNPPDERTTLSLNLLRFIDSEFQTLLSNNRRKKFPISLLLSAFFPPKVVHVFTNIAGIPEDKPLNEIDDGTIENFVNILQDTRLSVKGVRGYKYCQTSTGGVSLDEVNPTSLESLLLKGLFFTGETLDVVGPCGGYNLHFAFASGSLAGQAAAKNKDE